MVRTLLLKRSALTVPALLVAASAWSSNGAAQTPAQPYPPPPQPQPYPQQPYAQQGPQPYPQQPYAQQGPQPYPQQPYPAQPYPAQPYPQPMPQPYGPPPQYGPPPAGYGPVPAPYPQAAPVRPPPPPANRYRSPGEMVYLYGIGAAYGVGTGIWLDALGHVSDPGLALIAPLALGAAAPIAFYAWDYNAEFERGVASSMATGLLLGGVEGIAISGLQWQLTGGPDGGPNQWGFSTQTSVTFLTATAGGIGGYAFGEWLQPDPRNLALIASGAGWGAIGGALLGAGVVQADDHTADGMATWGFAGYNAGILATGLLSTVYTPSWQTLKYMWIGDVLGTLATTPVYLFYIGSSANPRHGLIVNALGGLVGMGVAAVFTANMSDSGLASWKPPFQITVGPTERGGAQLSAFGMF